MTDNATPQAQQNTVIFCTRTNSYIDNLLPGQDAYHRLAQLIPKYGHDLVMLTPEEALIRFEAQFLSGPEEITEERFQEMLNILPPVGWKNDSDGESFKICERTAGRLTAIFIRIGERYATLTDDIRTPHQECCRRAAEYFLANPTA
jgi:hypothetical protein